MSYQGIKSSVKGKSKKKNPYSKSKKKYEGIKSSSASKPTRKRSKPKSRRVRILPLKGGHLVEQLPETTLSIKGLTLKQLLSNTPKLMRMNGEETTVRKLKKSKTKSLRPAITAVCRHNDPFKPDATVRDHEVQIVGRDFELPIVDRKQKVLVSCDCVTGDTKVLTSKGWKVIQDIAEPFVEGQYDFNYLIDGKKVEGSAPFYKGKEPVFKLTTSNGVEIKATKDHRFLVKSGRDTPDWKTMGEIVAGDNLVLSNPDLPKLPKKTFAFNIMQFLGFMQGDGTSNSKGSGLDLQIYSEDKMTMLELFSDMGIVSYIEDSANNGQRVTFNQRAIELSSRYGYDNKNAVVWKHREQFYGYLSGLISADGSVSSKDNKVLSLQIRGSESYLRPIFEQLHRYGYTSTSLRLERKAGTKVESKSTTMTSKSDMYCLVISAKSFNHLKDYLELTPRFNDYEFKEFSDRIPLTKVITKSYSGRRAVYDITVPGPTRFIIDGSVVAHNCENFVYTWEYANSLHGASKIVYGNGDSPGFTNPSNSPALCKHLVALATKLIKGGY